MGIDASFFRLTGDSWKESWTSMACYASVRRNWLPRYTHIESVFFVCKPTTEEMCDWWYDEVIAKFVPDELKGMYEFQKESSQPYHNYKFYRQISIDLTKMTWDDASILLTLCRMIHEFPKCVKVAYKTYHKFAEVISLDTAVYIGLTMVEDTNTNHMPTGSNLHTGSWDHPDVWNYSFKERWKNYKDKRMIDKHLGNRINSTFMLQRPRTNLGLRDKKTFFKILKGIKDANR